MRKVLSFVLVLSLVLGSFGMAFAAPLSDVKGEDCADAVSVLTELGVVSGYPDGTYKPDNIVTRAEMAVIVVRALGLANYATGTSSFSDMAGHWSNAYVAYATSLGIIDGYPDGTFRPDNTVSYDEAAKMLVAALGYTPESLPGTWPANYVVKAQALGILDGITAGPAGAKRGDIATMTFQTLDQEIGFTNKDGEWKENGTDAKPDNMLTRLGAKTVEEVIIEGDEDSLINLRPYVGAFADVYVTKKDEKILAVVENSTFLTGEFDGTTFETDDVDYNISKDAQADIGSTPSAIGFSNGEKDDDFDFSSLSGEYTIAVDLSGKTIKEVYSVLKWEVSKDEMFSDSDADDIAEDQELFGFEFPLDNNDEIDLNAFELLGVDSLDDIKKDNVVYVYADSEDVIVKIEVGTEVVTDEITRVSKDADKYTIGGKAYDVTDAVVGAPFGDSVGAGDEVEAYLDFNGDIYSFELIEGEADNYAIVLDYDGGDGETGKFAEKGQIYLFLADGTDEVFVLDDVIDTSATTTTVSAVDIGNTHVSPGSLILYGTNKDGEVDEIILASNTSTISDQDITKKGYYNGLAINNSAVIFTCDSSTSKKADDYDVTTLDKVLDSSEPTVYAYDIDSNKIAAMLIASDVTGSDEVYGVVTDQGENNSDLGYEVTMLIDGKSATYDTDEGNYDGLTLYAVTFNAADEATLESAGSPSAIANVTNAGIFSLSGNVVEYTHNATDGALTVSGSAVTGSAILTLDSDVVVYVQDGSKSKFKVGNLRDITRKEGVDIEFYDVFDDDDVYDIVLIKNK